MASSVNSSGSQTATISTEHTLATITATAAVFSVVVDVANLTTSSTPDILEIRVYGKARSTDSERLIKVWTMMGTQSETLWFSPPLISPHYFKVTLKQTQGTGRSFPWAVYQAA